MMEPSGILKRQVLLNRYQPFYPQGDHENILLMILPKIKIEPGRILPGLLLKKEEYK